MMKPGVKSGLAPESALAPETVSGNRGSLIVIGKSLAATAAVAAIGSFVLLASGYALWGSANHGDSVSQQEAAAREAAFAALPYLKLSLVSEGDVSSAVEQMGLAPNEKSALLSNLKAPTPAVADIAPAKAGEPVGQATAQAQATPQGQPAPQVANPLRLAWVTLWDTDAEDGDAVRIDSGAFSRTVTLSKQPLTIAIPVPPNSVVKVTGIRDGEGGGITVGFASGGARAVFPIMSVGQTLGLRVQVN